MFGNIFGNNAPQPTQAPAPQTQPAQQAQPVQQAAPVGNIPNPQVPVTPSSEATAPTPIAAPAVDPNTPEGSLDPFKDLWNTTNSDQQAPANSGQFVPQVTQEQLAKATAEVNFANGVSPEVMQQVVAGGEGAVAALQQVVNSAAQQAMIQSTLVNNKLTQQAVQSAVDTTKGQLPDLMRQHAVTNHLHETNPLYQNPAVQPIIESTKTQLIEKYPQATQSEIAGMLNTYLVSLGQAFAPPTPVNPATATQETDWDAYAGLQPPS